MAFYDEILVYKSFTIIFNSYDGDSFSIGQDKERENYVLMLTFKRW